MHHVRRELWIWVDECFSFPAPKESVCLTHPPISFSASTRVPVLLCTLPLGLILLLLPCRKEQRDAVRQDKSVLLLALTGSFFPDTTADLCATACLPSTVVHPPTQLEPFFKSPVNVCRQVSRASGLGISGSIRVSISKIAYPRVAYRHFRT